MKDEDINETDSETAQLVRRLRTEADRLDPDLGGVEALVSGAVRQGRRRRTRRRVLTTTAGLLAAAALAAVAASALPGLVSRGTTAEPIATPSQLSSAPTSPTASPTASTDSAPPAADESVRSGVVAADVQDTVTGLLPDTLTVRQAESAREKGVNGFPWELTAALTVSDAKGTSRLFGGIGNGHYDDGCLGLADCQVTEVPGGGTLWTVSSPAGDKSGADRSFYYNRPDGGHVWFSQRNFASGSGPVTRDGLPLSDSAGRRLVTSQAWDQLFGR